jgi:hypothetical protein
MTSKPINTKQQSDDTVRKLKVFKVTTSGERTRIDDEVNFRDRANEASETSSGER